MIISSNKISYSQHPDATRMCKERGGVLVEFAITFPIFMLIVLGVYQFGVTLSQYFWYQRAVYEVSLSAADTTAQFAGHQISQKFDEFFSIYSTNMVSEKNITSTYDTNTRSYAISASGIVPILGTGGSQGFQINYSAPSLIKDANFILTNTSIFDQTAYYDCDFNRTDGPSGQDCS